MKPGHRLQGWIFMTGNIEHHQQWKTLFYNMCQRIRTSYRTLIYAHRKQTHVLVGVFLRTHNTSISHLAYFCMFRGFWAERWISKALVWESRDLGVGPSKATREKTLSSLNLLFLISNQEKCLLSSRSHASTGSASDRVHVDVFCWIKGR